MLPPVTEMERPMMADLAARAMDELIRLAQAGRQLWDKGVPGGAPETLNVAAYDSYGKLYLSPLFAISIGSGFLRFTATIVHVLLFHGRSIHASVHCIALH